MSKSPARTYTHPDFDYEARFATLGVANQQLDMAYVESGPQDAEPIVLLHGNPTWGFLYRDVMPPLAAHMRVIVPDLIGFGRSDRFAADSQYTLDNHVEAFGHLMDALKLENVTLVVHDWGGPIGLAWAADHPERLSRLVVMNSWAFAPEAHSKVPEPLRTFRKQPQGEWLVEQANLFVNAALPLGIVDRQRFMRAALAAYRKPFPTPASRAPVLAFPRDIPLNESDRAYARMARTDAGLSSLDQPTLLLWGARDPVFPPRVMRKFEARLRVVERRLYERASHFLQEDVGPALGHTISAFVRRYR